MALIWSLALLRKWVKYDHFYSYFPLSTNIQNSGASFFCKGAMDDDTTYNEKWIFKIEFLIKKSEKKVFFQWNGAEGGGCLSKLLFWLSGSML